MHLAIITRNVGLWWEESTGSLPAEDEWKKLERGESLECKGNDGSTYVFTATTLD